LLQREQSSEREYLHLPLDGIVIYCPTGSRKSRTATHFGIRGPAWNEAATLRGKKLMSKKYMVLIVSVVVLSSFICPQAHESIRGVTGLLKYDPAKAFQGYTLIPPMEDKTTYLVDMEGYIVHTWPSQYNPGMHALLLENGNLLRGGRLPDPAPVKFGGASGIVQEIDWNGKVVWEYRNHSPNSVQHHTFCRMPNGNTLVLCWEKKTREEAIAKGRKPDTVKEDGIWPDYVQEVNREGKVVWEWHVWDHLGTGPYEFNINFILPSKAGVMSGADWTHFNVVEYLPETDQVLLNSRNFGEFYLVNHKTGAVEFRWGNPCASGQGKCPSFLDDGDQILFGPHSVTKLENGNFLIFDNGWQRPEGNRSRAVEMDPKSKVIVWQYATRNQNSFYSAYQGSAQRLPNGNTLITSTIGGHIFEVTGAKSEVVWEFVIPTGMRGPTCFVEDGTGSVHRSYRYAPDYPAFKGKDLTQRRPFKLGCLELWRWSEPQAPQDRQSPDARPAPQGSKE
jgi:hypothetical protein